MANGQMFTVKELAGIVGVPQRRIQFYVDRGFIVPDGHISSGRGVAHRFSVKNVMELCVIRDLGSMGVALAVVKKILSWGGGGRGGVADDLMRFGGGVGEPWRSGWCVVTFGGHEEVAGIALIEVPVCEDVGGLMQYADTTGPHAWRFAVEQTFKPVSYLLSLLAGSPGAIVFDVGPILLTRDRLARSEDGGIYKT